MFVESSAYDVRGFGNTFSLKRCGQPRPKCSQTSDGFTVSPELGNLLPFKTTPHNRQILENRVVSNLGSVLKVSLKVTIGTHTCPKQL